MKRILTTSLLGGLILASLIAQAADQPLHGVAGVEVRVKESPAQRAVTDARGNFVLQGLAPGSYTLLFKAQQAKDIKTQSTTAIAVAQSYSIQVNGTKRPATRNAIPDQLLAGVAVPVEVGKGAQVRGVVGTAQAQKMVWIAPELGTHIPGHWAPADSPEAKGHGARSTQWMKGDDVQRFIDNHDSMHQEGFGGSGR